MVVMEVCVIVMVVCVTVVTEVLVVVMLVVVGAWLIKGFGRNMWIKNRIS